MVQVRFVSGYAVRHTLSAVLGTRLWALLLGADVSPRAASPLSEGCGALIVSQRRIACSGHTCRRAGDPQLLVSYLSLLSY
ncbi:exported hypothetical protein [Candidatus Sulfotelmatobacter kueseliae]|uniref:Uncharacterized protein n=1 Tax=Candidatus Sulfotelmatobacter kueseliae TaxID=2042962 RepID=A0A2U3KMA8_9BACT|nr:exported hypothetical protein [Candidatus Sulfotelmatobacter kueseliae]